MTDKNKTANGGSYTKTKLPEIFERPCKGRGGKTDVAYRVRGYRNGSSKLYQKTVGRRDRDGLTMAKLRVIRDALLRWTTLSETDRDWFRETFPNLVPEVFADPADAVKDRKKKKPTFDNLAAIYFRNRKAKKRQTKKNTKSEDVDRNRFDNYISPKFGDLCPHELTRPDVVAYCRELSAKLSFATVDKVTGLLTWIDNKTIDDLPHLQMSFKMPKFDTTARRKSIAKTIDKAIGDDEIDKLLATATDLRSSNVARIYDAACLVLLTGNSAVRGGALKRLRWEDIDLKADVFDLHESVSKSAGHSFAMNATAKKVLIERWIRQGQPRAGWVFPTRRDGFKGHWERTSAAVWEIYDAAGLDHLRGVVRPLHGVRHYLAKRLVRRDISIKKIQSFLGHDSIAATMLYTDVDAEAKRETVDLIDDLLSNGTDNK